jgi:hypothetical protein
MKLNIPKKSNRVSTDEAFNHQVRLNAEKTIRLARVREVLGGYSAQEILEILVDMAIQNYDDNINPENRMLPKQLRVEDDSDE